MIKIQFYTAQNNYTTTYYNTDNGLLSNGIKGLQWDEQSQQLWIATEAGIAIFNGDQFKHFTVENSEKESERILFLIKANDGSFISADEKNNIFLLKNGRIKKLNLSKEAKYQHFFALNMGIDFYKKKNFTPNFYPLLDKVIPINDTACYISSFGKLYESSIAHDNLKPTPFYVNSIFKIDDSIYLLDSMFHLYNSAFKRQKIFDKDLKEIKLSAEKKIYYNIGMQYPIMIVANNAYLLKNANGNLIAELICNEIPVDAAISFILHVASKNMIVMGTNSKGLRITKLNVVKSMRNLKLKTTELNAQYSQIEIENGTILTNQNQIYGNNPNIKNPINNIFYPHLYLSKDSVLYYTSNTFNNNNGVLHKYNFKSGVTTINPKIRALEKAIFTEWKGQFYCLTEKGLAKIVEDTLQYITTHNVIVYDIKLIDSNTFGYATCSGFETYDLLNNKTTTVIKTNNACTRALFIYNNYVFIGTYGGGYYIYSNGKYIKMPADRNNYLRYANCFLLDKYNNLWITTNRGLFTAPVKNFIDYFNNNTTKLFYKYYGKKDGLENTEFNGGCTPCGIVMANKNLSFPTMDGLVWVTPQPIDDDFANDTFFITEYYANGKKYEFNGEDVIKLPPNIRQIELGLCYPAWNNSENIFLEYRINNGIWKPLPTNNIIQILHEKSDYGVYKLDVRKKSGFTSEKYLQQTLYYRIKQRWLGSLFSYLALISLLAYAATLIYIFRLRKNINNQRKLEELVFEKTKELQKQNELLEKNDTIKSRLISIISHDIITPLKFLNVAGTNLAQKRNKMSDELIDETVTEISNTSRELQLLSTNILNWIKYQNQNRFLVKERFNVQTAITQVLNLLLPIAKQKNISIKVEIGKVNHIIQFFEAFKILTYNLVLNGINFSDSGEIKIKIEKLGDKILLQVSDQGIGMSNEQIQNIISDQIVISSKNITNKSGNGLGYLIIKDLLKTLNAHIDITSVEKNKGKKESGTTVKVFMPYS